MWQQSTLVTFPTLEWEFCSSPWTFQPEKDKREGIKQGGFSLFMVGAHQIVQLFLLISPRGKVTTLLEYEGEAGSCLEDQSPPVAAKGASHAQRHGEAPLSEWPLSSGPAYGGIQAARLEILWFWSRRDLLAMPRDPWFQHVLVQWNPKDKHPLLLGSNKRAEKSVHALELRVANTLK